MHSIIDKAVVKSGFLYPYQFLIEVVLKDSSKKELLEIISHLFKKIRLARTGWEAFVRLVNKIDPQSINSEMIYSREIEGSYRVMPETSVTWDAILTALEVSKVHPKETQRMVTDLKKVFDVFSKDQLSLRFKKPNSHTQNLAITKILPLSILLSMKENEIDSADSYSTYYIRRVL